MTWITFKIIWILLKCPFSLYPMNYESFIVKRGWSVIIPFETWLVPTEQQFVQHRFDYSLFEHVGDLCKRYQFQILTTLKAVNVWGTFIVFCVFPGYYSSSTVEYAMTATFQIFGLTHIGWNSIIKYHIFSQILAVFPAVMASLNQWAMYS